MPTYFFKGKRYIRVTRDEIGSGKVDPHYPATLDNWHWDDFGVNGIDAALYSGPVDYFFSGDRYIRVRRGDTGPGVVDAGYPKHISTWGWDGFGANGIDAALWSDTKCYFFKGDQYIRVTRGDTGQGVVDADYPKHISTWGWGAFGADGIDAALNSGSKCYFFKGNEYIRVTRGDIGPGTVDVGYPKLISNWHWGEFATTGIDAALFSGFDITDPVALADLGGNSNYLMADGGSNLTGVSVTVDITQDMTLTANGAPQGGNDSVSGWSFQLNCYSPKPEVDAVQQYIIGFDTSNCYAQVNNWKDKDTYLINAGSKLSGMSGNTLSAGHKLRIQLNNDAHANITGATFTFYDVDGSVLGSDTINLTDNGISESQLSPIVAYQLNIVGPGYAESATFSSGKGTIIHQAHQNMVPGASEPADAEANLITLENANTTYGQLSGTGETYFLQDFGVTTAKAPKPRQVGPGARFLPPLHIPPLEQRQTRRFPTPARQLEDAE